MLTLAQYRTEARIKRLRARAARLLDGVTMGDDSRIVPAIHSILEVRDLSPSKAMKIEYSRALCLIADQRYVRVSAGLISMNERDLRGDNPNGY